MLSDFGKRLADVLDKVITTHFDVAELKHSGSGDAHAKLLPDNIRQRLPKYWRETGELLAELNLERSIVTLRRMLEAADQAGFKVVDYEYLLGQLDKDIRHDLSRVKFEFVSGAKADLYEKGFGERRTDKAFPEALAEIKEAGICYAIGRNTACVFHSMRAAEYGLRALARVVGAPDGGKVPLEYAAWNDVIQRAQSRIDAVRLDAWTAPAKSNFRAFYNGSIADFIAFKDECRNLLMHTRSGFYNEHAAMNWRSRVCECMNKLSTRINENMTGLLLSESDFLH